MAHSAETGGWGGDRWDEKFWVCGQTSWCSTSVQEVQGRKVHVGWSDSW